jgi:hypothetical protein
MAFEQFVSVSLQAKIDPKQLPGADVKGPMFVQMQITVFFEGSLLVDHMPRQLKKLQRALQTYQLVAPGGFSPNHIAKFISERLDRCKEVTIAGTDGCGIRYIVDEPTAALPDDADSHLLEDVPENVRAALIAPPSD